MEFLPDGLEKLAPYPQFVVCEITPRPGLPGKFDKIPIDPSTGRRLKWGTPSNLMIIEQAGKAQAILEAENRHKKYSLGYILKETDPFFVIDLDNCIITNTEGTREYTAIAIEILPLFPGAAVQVSNSGSGIHIYGMLTECLPHKCWYPGIEFYTGARLIAISKNPVIGNINTDHTEAIARFVEKYMQQSASDTSHIAREWTTEGKEGHGILDDEELIKIGLQEKRTNDFSKILNPSDSDMSFADYFNCDIDRLSKKHPRASDSTSDTSYDASVADIAFASKINFYAAGNHEQIRRIMIASAMNRIKYERADYLPRTIIKHCGYDGTFYAKNYRKSQNNIPAAESQADGINTLGQILSISDQLKYFEGCVYIEDWRQVLVPGGRILNKDTFSDIYSGNMFCIDNLNGNPVKDPWEAFVRSRGYPFPKTNSSCFKPSMPDQKIIIREDGVSQANTYWPLNIKRIEGDASPFINHLKILFPHGDDAEILLSYFAAQVQYLGVKFHWCPFIQGTHGGGKSLLGEIMEYCVGSRYTYRPRASEIDSRFNDWALQKMLIIVEDLASTHKEKEVMEALKIFVDAKTQDIEPKHGKKVNHEVCANYIITTNDKDSLRIDPRERRFAVFYAAQQSKEDLIRDGLTNAYFNDLHKVWFAQHDGKAKILNLLLNYVIPDKYNPADGCNTAPKTTSMVEAIGRGTDRTEQQILDAIEEGQMGLKNGWVSSYQLKNYLASINSEKYFNLNKQKEFLKKYGYILHPGLAGGRVNNPVSFDGGKKPYLYIKHNHRDSVIAGGSNIVKAYEDAQK
jgi:primase-polymerase (primpol)-like protein